MDLTPGDEPGAPPAGAPASARSFRAGDHRAAVWSDTSRLPHPVQAVVEGPAGRGEAWLRLEPTTLALQLNDIEGRIGGSDVTIRRNGPRLRRAHRVVTITGRQLRWEVVAAADGGTRICDAASGRERWAQRSDGTRWAADDSTPDEIAAFVLFDHIRIEQWLGSNPLRYI